MAKRKRIGVPVSLLTSLPCFHPTNGSRRVPISIGSSAMDVIATMKTRAKLSRLMKLFALLLVLLSNAITKPDSHSH